MRRVAGRPYAESGRGDHRLRPGQIVHRFVIPHQLFTFHVADYAYYFAHAGVSITIGEAGFDVFANWIRTGKIFARKALVDEHYRWPLFVVAGRKFPSRLHGDTHSVKEAGRCQSERFGGLIARIDGPALDFKRDADVPFGQWQGKAGGYGLDSGQRRQPLPQPVVELNFLRQRIGPPRQIEAGSQDIPRIEPRIDLEHVHEAADE